MSSYPPDYRSFNESQLPLHAMTTPPDNGRDIIRTPSPTPSEKKELNKKGFINVRELMTWEGLKERGVYLVFALILIVLFILLMVFHDKIATALKPAAQWMHDTPGGWLIPIAILIVLSVPPLFGHEVVQLLVGLVWPIGIAFAIVAAGTLIGEVCTYYASKYVMRSRVEKMRRKSLMYSALERVIQEGGFLIAVIVRYSAIPGHLTTAVFATCGMSIWIFIAAAVLSLPKQLITVYIGVLLFNSDDKDNKSSKTASRIVSAVLIVVTIVAMHYTRRKLNQAKETVVYERCQARKAEMIALQAPVPTRANPPSLSYTGNKDDASVSVTPANPAYDAPYDPYGPPQNAIEPQHPPPARSGRYQQDNGAWNAQSAV